MILNVLGDLGFSDQMIISCVCIFKLFLVLNCNSICLKELTCKSHVVLLDFLFIICSTLIEWLINNR